MNLILNKDLAIKLKSIVDIGVDESDGLIMGVDESEQMIPLSQEVLELTVLSLLDRSKVIECFNSRFRIDVREVIR